MVFSTLPFVYGFFPVVFVLYFIWNNRAWRNAVLLAASLVFYAWGEPRLLDLMLLATLEAYVGGLLMERWKDDPKRKKAAFTVTVVLLVANLFVFKYLNFVADNRWKYLTEGLKTTLIITFFACLMGIVLGFLVGMIRSTYEKTHKLKVLNAICKVYLTVIRGTPVVVQLLIIYFVVFGSVRVDKVIVAILAFGINSGAYVAEIFRSGIMSIDPGQMEAGRSLGFNYAQTMWYIIMPQAFKTVLPTLCNEFISLLKETSVSGYIAIQDLTKGGDIIRSRTYSAFMPLIAVAIIYLIIVMIFTKLIQILERRLRQNER